ncbi:MAG TPA: recombinase family protein [Micromonospora sp.]
MQTVQAGAVDLTTPSGRMVARMLGATARYESEHKAARIRRKLAENAAAGKPHVYGWEPDRLTIRETEAAVIRDAARRILAGEPLRSIFRDLNARGLYNASGNPWTHPTFRGCLLNARHAGLREHNGQEVSVAAWPAILPPETWHAVRRTLTSPERVTTPDRAGRLTFCPASPGAACAAPRSGSVTAAARRRTGARRRRA